MFRGHICKILGLVVGEAGRFQALVNHSKHMRISLLASNAVFNALEYLCVRVEKPKVVPQTGRR